MGVKFSSLPLNCPKMGVPGGQILQFSKPPLEIYQRRKFRVSSSVNKKVGSFLTLCPIGSGLNMYTYVIILYRSQVAAIRGRGTTRYGVGGDFTSVLTLSC